MLLPIFKRLYRQDFEQQFQGLVDKLSYTINSGFETVYEALNNKIDLTNNIACTIKDIQITVDASGTPVGLNSFSVDSQTVKVGTLIVGRVDNLTNPSSYPTGGVFVSWVQNNNSVIINNITGLAPKNQYQLRIVAFYD